MKKKEKGDTIMFEIWREDIASHFIQFVLASIALYGHLSLASKIEKHESIAIFILCAFCAMYLLPVTIVYAFQFFYNVQPGIVWPDEVVLLNSIIIPAGIALAIGYSIFSLCSKLVKKQ